MVEHLKMKSTHHNHPAQQVYVCCVPADDGDVLPARHGQVHGGGAELRRAGELGQAERGDADAEEAPRAVAHRLHRARHVALGQPQPQAPQAAVAGPPKTWDDKSW